MKNLIKDIAAHCHSTAEKRGKDISCWGCVGYMVAEIREFLSATYANRVTQMEAVETAEKLLDEPGINEPGIFGSYYHKNIHNTTMDELADVLIVAATWTHERKRAEEMDSSYTFNATKSGSYFINAGIRLTRELITNQSSAEMLHRVVKLKMYYNDLRG